MSRVLTSLAVWCFMIVLYPVPAMAQTIGTFSWQLAPYCNVLTLTVAQERGGFRLTGVEDLCDPIYTPQTVDGTAVLGQNGQAYLGLDTGAPGGFSGKGGRVSARVDPGSLAGHWSDDAGRSGTLVPVSTTRLSGTQRGGVPMTFTHTVGVDSRPSPASNISCFSHPQTDGNSAALILLTQNRGLQTNIASLVNASVSLYYDDDGTGLPGNLASNVWCLSRNDSQPMPTGARFTLSIVTP